MRFQRLQCLGDVTATLHPYLADVGLWGTGGLWASPCISLTSLSQGQLRVGGLRVHGCTGVGKEKAEPPQFQEEYLRTGWLRSHAKPLKVRDQSHVGSLGKERQRATAGGSQVVAE